MRHRGSCFRSWSNNLLPTTLHTEELDDGMQIEIQARLSRTGGTQLFIGVYDVDGIRICEEAYQALPGQNVSRALVMGTQRARAIATGQATSVLIAHS